MNHMCVLCVLHVDCNLMTGLFIFSDSRGSVGNSFYNLGDSYRLIERYLENVETTHISKCTVCLTPRAITVRHSQSTVVSLPQWFMFLSVGYASAIWWKFLRKIDSNFSFSFYSIKFYHIVIIFSSGTFLPSELRADVDWFFLPDEYRWSKCWRANTFLCWILSAVVQGQG